MHSYTKSSAATQFAELARRIDGNPLCRIRVRQCFPGPGPDVPVAIELEILATSIARTKGGTGPDSPVVYGLDRRWWRFGILLEDVPHSVLIMPADLDIEHPHLTPIGCCLTHKDERPFPDLSTLVRRLYLTLTFQIAEPKDCLNDRPDLAHWIAHARARGELPTDRRPLEDYTPSLAPADQPAGTGGLAAGDPDEIVVGAETIEEMA